MQGLVDVLNATHAAFLHGIRTLNGRGLRCYGVTGFVLRIIARLTLGVFLFHYIHPVKSLRNYQYNLLMMVCQ